MQRRGFELTMSAHQLRSRPCLEHPGIYIASFHIVRLKTKTVQVAIVIFRCFNRLGKKVLPTTKTRQTWYISERSSRIRQTSWSSLESHAQSLSLSQNECVAHNKKNRAHTYLSNIHRLRRKVCAPVIQSLKKKNLPKGAIGSIWTSSFI